MTILKSTIETYPTVSIAIPCYNHQNFVKETIQSVIDQDYKNIELIIIDDGSTDLSAQVIQELLPICKVRFVRFEFRSRENKGLSETLNEMLSWCNGEYFSGLASDDTIKPNKLSTQVKHLELNMECVGVFGAVEVIQANGERQEVVNRYANYNFKDIFLHSHNLPAPTQLIRLSSIRNVGGFKKDIILEDWYMWLLLTENGGTLTYLSQVFAGYRRHSGNISSQLEVMRKGRNDVLNLYKNNKLYSLAKAHAILMYAIDLQKINSFKSVGYFFKSVIENYSVVFSRNFIVFAIRMFRLKK